MPAKDDQGNWEMNFDHIDALIACTLHLNPDTLSDDEWARAWGRVSFYHQFINHHKE